MAESCMTCKHHGILLRGQNGLVHVCRLNPPQVIGALVGGPGGQPAWMTTSAWPGVGDEDRCSHHAPDVILSS